MTDSKENQPLASIPVMNQRYDTYIKGKGSDMLV